MNWNEYFRQIAHTVKSKSKDKYTNIGAVIVGRDNEIISTGYNSFPRGIDDSIEDRQERPEKYYWFSHAETNAIVNAARIGVSTKGSKMYLTCGVPCADCMRNIINSGIKEIWIDEGEGAKGKKWEESGERSLTMAKESGLKIHLYRDE
jgi:dCMP deaminase